MYFTTLLSLAALGAAAPQLAARSGTDVQVVTDNPNGAIYQANLSPNAGTDYHVSGYVRASVNGERAPVSFEVVMNGLPKEGGPFLYHIHENPVADDGNCTSTGAHLDPYGRGEDPPCVSSDKKSCQVGDLSGKYGKMPGPSYFDSYSDPYVSLRKGDKAFAGSRSITVHLSDKTRIACGNFKMLWGGFEDFNWEDITTAGGKTAGEVTQEATSKAIGDAFAKLRNGEGTTRTWTTWSS